MTVKQVENARREGFLRGLKKSHTMLRKARNYQAQKERSTPEADADLKGEFKHGASLLHDLCLRLQAEIKKAS
jgi:hypothetical protein